tara:strand:- start:599 stop:1357 length:759 start_codon:yes stop_codon:yes gene_type:complete
MVEAVEIKQEDTTEEKPVEQAKVEEVKRPEGLPEKFKTVEDMAKSYSELESKLGAEDKSFENEKTQPESKKDTLEIEPDQKAAEKAVESAGLNMDALQTEYNEKGTLDEKSFAALEKAGIPKSYVDAFIQGQEAVATQMQNTIKAEVGGEESYTEIVTWAKDALNPQEIAAFNKTVNSNDLEAVKLAVTGLKARHDAVNGTDPKLISGKAGTDTGGGYNSWAQVTAAMKDARYANDPAFRSEVQDKISKSKL